jgi:type IV pilus assembly protein PilA
METAPWYYVNADRQRQGPVPAATIRELAAAGSVEARTLVWRQGMPQWQPLEAMAGELGIVLAATAPSPTAFPAACAGRGAPHGQPGSDRECRH